MTKAKKVDIQSREDIQKIVWRFYEKALSDPIIGFFFTQVTDLEVESHVPKVVNFWETMLFGENIMERSYYSGNMLKAHVDVDAKARIQTGHFTRWLYLFHNTVDSLYEGARADLLKEKATKMANSMSDALRIKRGESRIGVESLGK